MFTQLKEKKCETRILPNKPRTRELIATDIRCVMTALVKGKLRWPWYLWGAPGVGKTCAALCLIDFATGRYWTADQWADDLNQARTGNLDEWQPGKTKRVMVEVAHERNVNGQTVQLQPGDWYETSIESARSIVIKPSDLWHRMKAAALFVLDDIGLRTAASEHQRLSVKRVLDDRIGLPTIVIGNRPPAELADVYGQATARRIVEGTISLYGEKVG